MTPVAWEPLGWTPAFFCEIEPFPCALLAHHYPDVPNLGDMTKVDWSKPGWAAFQRRWARPAIICDTGRR